MGNCRNKLNKIWIILIVMGLGSSMFTGCKEVNLPEFSLFKQEEKKAAPEQSDKSSKPEKVEKIEKSVTIKPEYKKVNIRPEPSTKKAAIAVLNGGDPLTFIQEKGNWLNIRFISKTGVKQEGWIFKFLVKGYDRPAPVVSKVPAKKKAVPTAKEPVQKTSKAQQKIKPKTSQTVKKQVSKEPAPVKPETQPEPEKGKNSGISIL